MAAAAGTSVLVLLGSMFSAGAAETAEARTAEAAAMVVMKCIMNILCILGYELDACIGVVCTLSVWDSSKE